MEHWADYVVFVLFLMVSLGIGLYHALTGGKQRTTQEFIMADRKLSMIPASLSMMVSYQSAIMILGYTAEMYNYGTHAWPMSLIGFTLSILGAERIVVPWMYPLKLTSVYQYFELRYDSKVLRIFAASLGILSALFYMGVATFAPALALEAATGISAIVTIPLMSAVCVAYTALGGIKAVVWTDVFQFIVIFAGMLGILIKGAIEVGGFSAAMDVARSEDRVHWINIDPDPTVRHTLWGYLIGWSTNWGFAYGLHQSSIQRYSTVTSLTSARLVLLLNIPALVLLVSMSSMIGIIVLAYFSQKACDPMVSGQAGNPNQILPVFVKETFSNVYGFSGLFIATLFSGALSSISSSLSACAANIWADMLAIRFGHFTEYKAALINKIIVLVSGVVSAGLAFMAALVPGPIIQASLALVGSVAGPLIGMYLISGIKLFRWVDWKGVLTGGIVATALNFWISFGSINAGFRAPPLAPVSCTGCDPPMNVTSPREVVPLGGLARFYSLSYQWYAPLGLVVTMATAIIVSAIIYFTCRNEKLDIDEKLFIPFRKLCSFHEDSQDDRDSAIPALRNSLSGKRATSDGRISIASSDKFAILDVSTVCDGSYTQYNPPVIASETNL